MQPTLLLADDSATIRRVIELTLANEDIRVVSVADGEEAIRRIDSEPPTVVLADVSMPRVDGYAVAEHVKQSPALRHIPVILLTGAFEPIDEAKARAIGCDGVLVKPFESHVLLGRVRELVAGQRTAALWPADLPREDPAAALEDSMAFKRRSKKPDDPFADLEPSAAPTQLDHASASQFASDIQQLRGNGGPEHPGDPLDLPDWDLNGPPGTTLPPEQPAPPAAAGARNAELGTWDLPPAPAPEVPRWPAVASGPSPMWPQPVGPEAGLRSIAPRPPAARPQAPTPWPPPPKSTAGSNDVTSPRAAANPGPATTAHAGPPVVGPDAKVSLSGAFSALLAAERTNLASRTLGSAPLVPEAAVEDLVRRVVSRVTEEIVRKLVLDSADRLIKEELERVRNEP